MSEFEMNNTEAEELDFEESEELEKAEETDIEAEEDRYIDTGSLPASILGGLVGMLIALILNTLVYGIFKHAPYILFFLFPLCVCVMSLAFKGSLTVSGLISEIVFTALGIFLFPAFISACNYVTVAGTSVFSIPLVALTQIGTSNFFTGFAFSSKSVLPIIIAIIGIAVSWQIFRLKKAKLYD